MELTVRGLVAKLRNRIDSSPVQSARTDERPLRILAVHRYYWPDTPPYASILRTIAARWVDLGYQVDVLTSQPSYKPEAGISARARVEVVDGVRVRRVSLPSDRLGKIQKLINMLLFPSIIFLRILCGRRYEVVMCSTAPPVFLGFAVAAAARIRKSQFVYHCMDIHPEIGALSGEFANPLVYRALRRMDEWTCRRAAAVIVLSEDMSRVLIGRDPLIASRVQIINNFDLPDYDNGPSETVQLSIDHEPSPDRIRIVFAGNLGRFQGLQNIIRAAKMAETRSGALEIVFMGDGAAKSELIALAADTDNSGDDVKVRFLPHGTPSQARALMRTADYGLVPLVPDVIQYAYPSKVGTYLSENLPVMAIVEPNSELARMVVDQEIGLVATPNDVADLARLLEEAISAKGALPTMRSNAAKVAADRFSREALLERWANLPTLIQDRK